MMFILAFVVNTACPDWGEQVLLGAFDKILAESASVSAASPPCERYLRAIALDETDGDPRPLLVSLKDTPGALGDWANLRLAELEWRAKVSAGSTRPPSPDFNQGYMTKLYQFALILPPEKLYAATVLESPGPRRRAQLEVLAEVGASPDLVQRELFVEYPDSPQAPLAFPKATLQDLVRRASVATDKHMNDDVLKTVAAAQKMQPKPEEACALSFFAGAAQRKLRKYAPAEAALSEAVNKCPDGDYKKRAHFLLGQVQVIARSYAVAEPTMKKFAQQYKADSLVDDAIFNVAASAERAGDSAKAIQLYEQVTKIDPPGDMCAEAAFRVAYGYYKGGELQKALDRFVKIGQGLCGSDDYEKARAWYWESRTRSALKDAQAGKPLRLIVDKQPLSYYALLARERLGIDEPLATEQAASQASVLPPLPKTAITKRVQELSKQGLFKEAQRELASELKDAPLDAQAAYAPLLAEARDYHRAHILFRSTLKGLLGSHPTEASLPAWQLAYPRPFAGQIADSEKKEGLEAEFLLSLIREESAFQLDAGSWANAYGLTQMILDTAHSTARDMKLGFAPTADQLREEPGLSIKLGGHHLAMLKRIQPRPPLILAAYNSGMGNVKKWLAARGEKPMDEFIEEIPLDETRGYVKRIMRTWATYRTLLGKSLPRLNLTAPSGT